MAGPVDSREDTRENSKEASTNQLSGGKDSDAMYQPGGLDSLTTDEFLKLVGQRVRFHRTADRMSRKRLAEVSGVSERYLAQLEAGQGNMSIALLRKVTTAIKLPLNVLLSDETSDRDSSAGTQVTSPSSANSTAAELARTSAGNASGTVAESDSEEPVAELS